MCLVLGDPFGAALAFDAGFIVVHEGVGGGVEGLAFGLEQPGPALAAQFEIPVFGDLFGDATGYRFWCLFRRFLPW